MFGPHPARVYYCACGWRQYVYGAPSDVLWSQQQLPPTECAQCQGELQSRAPNWLERLQHRKPPL